MLTGVVAKRSLVAAVRSLEVHGAIRSLLPFSLVHVLNIVTRLGPDRAIGVVDAEHVVLGIA